MDELNNLIPSFQAALMGEISEHRLNNGDLNTVAHFAAAVACAEAEVSRQIGAIAV